METKNKTTDMDVFNNVELMMAYGISTMGLLKELNQLKKQVDDLEKRVSDFLFDRFGEKPEYQSVVDVNLAMINVVYANATIKRTFEAKIKEDLEPWKKHM